MLRLRALLRAGRGGAGAGAGEGEEAALTGDFSGGSGADGGGRSSNMSAIAALLRATATTTKAAN